MIAQVLGGPRHGEVIHQDTLDNVCFFTVEKEGSSVVSKVVIATLVRWTDGVHQDLYYYVWPEYGAALDLDKNGQALYYESMKALGKSVDCPDCNMAPPVHKWGCSRFGRKQ